jgi:hypothetical protein
MTEGIQTFAHYRHTYKAKQFLLRVLFIIGFVLFTRFYFQSLLPIALPVHPITYLQGGCGHFLYKYI